MKRKYEMFLDYDYYDTYCVRDTSDITFDSITSWHFNLKEDAKAFLNLLNKTVD